MGTREKNSPRSTQEPDAMAGHRPPHSHSPSPSVLPLRRNRSRSSNVVLPVLQSEIRYASTAWLETPMGALRRDEALQRERFRRTAPKESSRASIAAMQRFCNVNIGTIGVEAHANVTGPRSPYDIAK